MRYFIKALIRSNHVVCGWQLSDGKHGKLGVYRSADEAVSSMRERIETAKERLRVKDARVAAHAAKEADGRARWLACRGMKDFHWEGDGDQRILLTEGTEGE